VGSITRRTGTLRGFVLTGSDSDDEDETAALMAELAKIKQERAEEKARQVSDLCLHMFHYAVSVSLCSLQTLSHNIHRIIFPHIPNIPMYPSLTVHHPPHHSLVPPLSSH
jgi:hypothetical protein